MDSTVLQKPKVILLAAGMGTRLGLLTKDKPKCMVPYKGQPLIDHILRGISACGLDDISIVGGYQIDVLRDHLKSRHLKFYVNDRFDQTNMVESLFCARQELVGADVLVSYADIIYRPSVLQALLAAQDGLNIVVDLEWKKLWDMRLNDPLTDAETMKFDRQGRIRELGKKPASLADIQGQYIGLFKFSRNVLPQILKFYDGLDRSAIYDGKDFARMYMTSFLQLLIDRVMPAQAVFIRGGWLEFDTGRDVEQYQKNDSEISLSL